MPCNSDYLAPNEHEQQLQRTAKLLVYVRNMLDHPIGKELRAAAKDSYCCADYVPALCATIRAMTFEQKEAIMWDGSKKLARDLADWWEAHQAADRARVAAERKAKRDAKLRESALGKLTPAERRALGLGS